MSEHDRDAEGRFTRRANELFNASVADLDAATRARLARARSQALERRPAAPLLGLFGRWRLAPAGAVLAAALVALVVVRGPVPEQPAVDAAALADLELLLGDEELEMLEEIEFYAWLEMQAELARPAPADDGVG